MVVPPNREGPHVIPEWEDFVTTAERSGASLIATGEGQTMWQDPYVWLALAARVTERVLLGPVVTAPGLRHPTVLASTISTIQRLSDGRAFCGIGTGKVTVTEIGLPPFRLDDLAEYATAVRALTAGDEIAYGGAQLHLRWSSGAVPIWIAAEGPRGLRLAGRIADGVIIGQTVAPDIVAHVQRHVAAGAIEAGRSPDDVEVWYMVRAHVATSEKAGYAEPFLQEYVARLTDHLIWGSRLAGGVGIGEDLLRTRGIRVSDEIGERLLRYRRSFSNDAAYAAGYNPGPGQRNVELLDRLGLREWAERRFYMTGPVERIAAQLGECVAAGARNFIVGYTGAGDRSATAVQMGSVLDAVRAS
jgi:5,10-methylenetetrahydromethanopterin reductase